MFDLYLRKIYLFDENIMNINLNVGNIEYVLRLTKVCRCDRRKGRISE